MQSTRRTKDSESVENRYVISSLDNIKTIARSVRLHWNVENKLHWVMDVDFDEDACRVRVDHAPENFALLRQIAHNLLKQESTKGISIRRKIHKAGWDNEFLVRILIGVWCVSPVGVAGGGCCKPTGCVIIGSSGARHCFKTTQGGCYDVTLIIE